MRTTGAMGECGKKGWNLTGLVDSFHQGIEKRDGRNGKAAEEKPITIMGIRICRKGGRETNKDNELEGAKKNYDGGEVF